LPFVPTLNRRHRALKQNRKSFTLFSDNGSSIGTLKHRIIDIHNIAFQFSAAGNLRHDAPKAPDVSWFDERAHHRAIPRIPGCIESSDVVGPR
jgi:hypothetical protein